MNLKLKKVNNQIYIVDVDAKVNRGDVVYNTVSKEIYTFQEIYVDYEHKVIATPEQIDIDNLYDKYLEALAEKVYPDREKDGFQHDFNAEIRQSYLQSKKEASFTESDVKDAYENILRCDEKFCENFKKFIQQLKVSKITDECGVVVEVETKDEPSYVFGNFIYKTKTKLTNGKIIIEKIKL